MNNTLQFDLGSYQNWIAGKGNRAQSNSQVGRYTGARSLRQLAMTLRFQF